jgi:hypothetical protein
MYYIDFIQSPAERERERERERTCAALLGQSAYTEKSIPPFVEEETLLLSRDRGTHRNTDIETHTRTQTGRRSHKPTLGK